MLRANVLCHKSPHYAKASGLEGCLLACDWRLLVGRLGGKPQRSGTSWFSPMFWTLLGHAITFQSPFFEFIHQIEADRPSLAR
jgi:hypothetical protein